MTDASDSKVKLSESQFLALIEGLAGASYVLVEALAGLHTGGFADWHESLRIPLAPRDEAIIGMLAPQIQDDELREAFSALWEQTKALIAIDQQLVSWLAEYAGLTGVHDARDKAELNRRLNRLASEGPEGPQGPVWAMRPEYQEMAEASRQAMAAASQAKHRCDRRLEQLLSGATGDEPKQTSEYTINSKLLSGWMPTPERVKKSSTGKHLSLEEVQRFMVPYQPRERFPYLQMEVVTYVDLWEQAQIAVSFIERVWHTFEPFQVKLEANLRLRGQSPHSSSRTFGLKPEWKKWAETRQLLLDGQVESIVMYDWAMTHSYDRGIEPDVYLGVHFGELWWQMRGHPKAADSMFDPRGARLFVVSISTRPWAGRVSAEIQEQVVRLTQDLFQAVEGACGYIDIGDQEAILYSRTPYEQRLQISSGNTRRLCWSVRGAFWGNLLSGRHVERLGGSQLVKQEAPCQLIVSLSDGETQANRQEPLYLQLTPALETTTPEDYARLEAFFAPILISSEGQRGIFILDPAVVAHFGDGAELVQAFSGSVQRVVLLPQGALLIEYEQPAGQPAAYRLLQQTGCDVARGYRAIPQLQSLWWPDDALVGTLPELVPPRPKSGPVFPAILVQPCISGHALRFRASFAAPPTNEGEEHLRNLTREWSALEYETGTGQTAITYCSVPERQESSVIWYADLAPVGQDAYFQLILMLDEFSKMAARLTEVHVGAWSRQ
jgi:hypothetical protein